MTPEVIAQIEALKFASDAEGLDWMEQHHMTGWNLGIDKVIETVGGPSPAPVVEPMAWTFEEKDMFGRGWIKRCSLQKPDPEYAAETGRVRNIQALVRAAPSPAPVAVGYISQGQLKLLSENTAAWVFPGRDSDSVPVYLHPPRADLATKGNAALVEAAQGMKRIVEEIDGAMKHGTWRDEHGTRLKDTPEWVALYNALASPAAATTPAEDVGALVERGMKLADWCEGAGERDASEAASTIRELAEALAKHKGGAA